MRKKTLETLEFNKITEKLSEYAVNEETEKRIKSLKPYTDFSEVKRALSETDAATVLTLKFSSPRISKIKSPESLIKRINAGGALSLSEFINISNILKCSDELKKYYSDKNDILKEYFDVITTENALCEKITGIVISEEEMADSASTELYSIRKKIRSESLKIKNNLNEMVRSERIKKFLQDPIVSVRGDRYVIPVKAEYRNEVPGIVHDVSASGGTLFVEPQSSVNANNMLSELSIQEKREIEKVLYKLTQEVAEITEVLKANYEAICEIDYIFAKAKLSISQKAVMPKINSEGRINIKRGRHPLISSDIVVPEDIRLGDEFDTLIVTGPNTGGKTVVLKMVGLFTIMAQSGLMVPADDGTELSVFSNVFADIGDEQSIEQSLSTFSAHMKNIVNIIKDVSSDSLVLFDELGAGTDPTEGAALACSILEYVRGFGAKTVATTHYSELKLYAISTLGVENGSLEFDVNTLSPTYKLLIGVPGKSNAFAISKRLGLPEYIIEKAKDKISDDDIKFEDVISSIESDRQIAEKSRIEQEKLKEEIKRLKLEIEKQKDNLEKQKSSIIEKANKKASLIVEGAKEEVEKLLLDMRKAKKEKEEKEALSVMEELKKELNIKIKKTNPKQKTTNRKKSNANINTLKPGTPVLLIDLNDKGTVLSINKKDETAVIQMGIMKTVSSISNLVVLEDETEKNINKFISSQTRNREITAVKTEIDLRGMNLEEAMDEVDRFLDRSVMSGVFNVTIIHGKGTGVLRTGITTMLRKHPHVKSFRAGRFGEGENGVTIVELK